MYLGKSKYDLVWFYNKPITNGSTVTLPIGGPGTTFTNDYPDIGPVLNLPYFSFDLFANQSINLDIEPGITPAAVTAIVTLVTLASVHNTVYDLPPPYNKDGYFVLAMPWLRLRARNTSGFDATVFQFCARAWKP
jgi:hypothetical protein